MNLQIKHIRPLADPPPKEDTPIVYDDSEMSEVEILEATTANVASTQHPNKIEGKEGAELPQPLTTVIGAKRSCPSRTNNQNKAKVNAAKEEGIKKRVLCDGIKKIDWNEENTQIICELFDEQANKGNRPNTYMNSVGYAEVEKRFTEKTGIPIERAQIKVEIPGSWPLRRRGLQHEELLTQAFCGINVDGEDLWCPTGTKGTEGTATNNVDEQGHRGW
ncbi:hypothetical protein ACP4OV_021133 [Aristida adscensionis]